jgi:hypothetical protein
MTERIGRVVNLIAALSLTACQFGERSGYADPTPENTSPSYPCEGVDYDPSIGTLIRPDGTLIGVGTEGQGVVLTADHTIFDNGEVDIIYHTIEGKRTHPDAVRFTDLDGESTTRRIGFDASKSRVTCPPTNK